MTTRRRVLVTGAGGFLGHHLSKRLVLDGHWVRAADRSPPYYESTPAAEFHRCDLRREEDCVAVTEDIDDVYHLAADMGGIGFISQNHADVARNNTLIDLHMLEACRRNEVERFLFTSSACVYNQAKQQEADTTPLAESDAMPADPEKGYGWEKLYAEQLCEYYQRDFGLQTHIVRLHNVYGPLGTYDGGREKAPAATCRKIAMAEDGDAIEIWGDGQQTRSFLYVDDFVEGIMRILQTDTRGPINLGSTECVTIDELYDIVAAIAGKRITKVHRSDEPQGVRGRNSDNSLLLARLHWQPTTSLRTGMRATYTWIASELQRNGPTRQHGATAAVSPQ